MKGHNEQLKINGFVWNLQIKDEHGRVIEEEESHNLIPNDGLDFLIGAPFGLSVPISDFYLGLFRGDYTPTHNTKATDIPSNLVEMVDYSESTRPVWTGVKGSNAAIDNLDSKAEFTITQDRTIYGAFLVSSEAKSGGGGLLLSCVRFSSPKQITAGQTVKLAGGLAYISN